MSGSRANTNKRTLAPRPRRRTRDLGPDHVPSNSDLAGTVARVSLACLRQAAPFDRGHIFHLDSGQSPQLIAAFPDGEEPADAITPPHELVSQLERSKPCIIADVTLLASGPYARTIAAHGNSAVLLAALYDSEVLVGLLVLEDKTAEGLTERSEFVMAIAAQLAPVISQGGALTKARQSLRELSAIYECAQRLQSLHTPETLAREIIRVLERTLSYEYPAVFLLDSAKDILVPYALGESEQALTRENADWTTKQSRELQLGRGITSWVARTGESARVSDVRNDPRYLAAHPDIRSELCVPLRIGADVIGVVNVESPRPSAYTESDQRMLETVAAQMAIAIQDARLFDQVRQGREQLQVLSKQLLEAHESERRKIARELHDEIGQAATAVQMCLLSLEPLVTDPAGTGLLHDAISTIERVLQQVRDLSLNLRPSILDDFGLAAALRWYAERQAQRAGFTIHLDLVALEGARPRLASEIETVCFRATQEALTNIIRHAQARTIWITVKHTGAALALSVRDDGIGFDVRAAMARGAAGASMGLMGLRERVILVGGKIDIQSAPGQGTCITVSVPLTTEKPFVERRTGKRRST